MLHLLGLKKEDNLHEISKLSDELYEFYQNAEAYDVFSDFLKFASRKEEYYKDVKWAVISNFDIRLHAILHKLDVSKYFDLILTSEEAKCSKPSSEIFEKTIDILNLKQELEPCQILHIGDDPKKDCPPNGWHRILMQRDRLGSKFKYVCHSFDDVSKLIL